MRCKTEQEDPGCLPDPEAKAEGDLRVIVAVPKGLSRPQGAGQDKWPSRFRRKPRTGQNPAYSHLKAGVLRQRGAPVLFLLSVIFGPGMIARRLLLQPHCLFSRIACSRML